MRRLTTGLSLTFLAAGLLAGGVATQAQAQQPRHMQQSMGQPRADASKAENCGTPDEPKACPPLPRNNLTEFPRNRAE